jgi:hypothetical protein
VEQEFKQIPAGAEPAMSLGAQGFSKNKNKK